MRTLFSQRLHACLRVVCNIVLPVMTQTAVKKYRSFDKKDCSLKMKRDATIDSMKRGIYRGILVGMIIQLFYQIQTGLIHAHYISNANAFWLTPLRLTITIIFSMMGYVLLEKTIFKIRDVIANQLNGSLSDTVKFKKYLTRYGFLISSYLFVELLNNARHSYHLGAYRMILEYNNPNIHGENRSPYFDLGKSITGNYMMDYRLRHNNEQSLYKDGVLWMDHLANLDLTRAQTDFLTVALDECYELDRNLLKMNLSDSYNQQRAMVQRDFLIYLMENNNEQENKQVLDFILEEAQGANNESNKRVYDSLLFQVDLMKKYIFKDKLEHSLNERLKNPLNMSNQANLEEEEETIVKI